MKAAFLLRGHFGFTKYGARKIGGTPHGFSLVPFNFPLWSDKGKNPGKKVGQQLVLVFALKAKTKRTLGWGPLRLVAIWDLPLMTYFECTDYRTLALQGCWWASWPPISLNLFPNSTLVIIMEKSLTIHVKCLYFWSWLGEYIFPHKQVD